MPNTANVLFAQISNVSLYLILSIKGCAHEQLTHFLRNVVELTIHRI